MRSVPALLLILVLNVVTFSVGARPLPEQQVELQLLSTVEREHADLPLAAEEWAYLRKKGELVLGVAAPGLPPLDIPTAPDFKGITADIASLLKCQLRVPIRVLLFPDRSEAVEALKGGKIDMLASANNREVDRAGLKLTTPYAADRPALYKRSMEERVFSEDLAGMTIAVVEGYRSIEFLTRQFPRAHFVSYRSVGQAMASTAFGKTDLFLGNTLSARYLINHSYFNYIKTERVLPLQSDGFAYALRSDDNRLRRIINTALDKFGKAKLDSVSRRWVGGGYDLPEAKLRLSPEERSWVAQHPEVTIAINDDQAPIAFVDKDGNFNGMAADILDLITQRTGLRFRVTRVDKFSTLVDAVRDGEADLSIISRSPERESDLRFSPPFITSTFALVARRDEAARNGSLPELVGKRLAIARGHVAIADIRRDYPGIDLVETPTSLDSLQMVADGNANAAVIGLILGRYYISKMYEDTLAVSGTVDKDTALGHFAMRRSEIELQSILSKVILDIPPEEMNTIAGRWRPNPAMSGQTWRDHRQVIYAVVLGAIALTSIFVLWAVYLRLQIRKRLASERALSDQLHFIDTVGDATPQPIYVRDTQGRMIGATRSYQEILGVSIEAMKGKTALESAAGFETVHDLHRAYMEAMKHDAPLRKQRYLSINGEDRWIDHWIHPFRDSSGKIQGVVCGWHDITEQQDLVESMETLVDEVEQARKAAEQASREKTTFLATMSHEIRTPMSAVIGTLELALRQADQGILDRSSIEVAYSSAESLLGLIGDVLDIVRIESGRLSLAPKRANLRELVESVAKVFDGLAIQKGLNLILDLDSSIKGDVLIDPVRFKQILSNLVSNAIKFTPAGFVKVEIGGQTLESEKIRIRMAVSDTGIGISEENQQQLFRPFSQVRQASLGKAGAGLGLVISRSLCELMGGKLTMKSVPGQGTTVEVDLVLYQLEAQSMPADAIRPVQHEADDQFGHRPLRVLVVDDYAIHRQLLCQQLAYLDHEFVAAENGEQALELWRSSAFDVIITDCQMPGMSGIELADTIRREESLIERPACLILGLTADAQREEIERSLRSGMTDCLVKPIGLDVLRTRLQAVFGQATAVLEDAHGTMEQTQTPAATAASIGGLDALASLTGGDAAKTHQLAIQVIKAIEDARQSLRTMVAERDLAGIAILTHQMRGVARVLNDSVLEQQCRDLEAAGADGFSGEALQRPAAALDKTMAATLDWYNVRIGASTSQAP